MNDKIKNNMIPKEIKDVCRSCESNIFAQNKGCAFRILGNEYCDYVLDATKLYLDLQTRWDSLREYYQRKADETKDSTALYDKWTRYSSVLDKMNELEGGENENK